MNKERLLKLADTVEKGHHKFNGVHAALDMSHWARKIYIYEAIPDRELTGRSVG